MIVSRNNRGQVQVDVYKRQTPYSAMYEKPPPQEIEEILEFPMNNVYKFDKLKFYNKVAEETAKQVSKG